MLLNLPRKYRSETDDHAPVDYTFVGSVAEGARRRESAPIHQESEHASVRHRVNPNERALIDDYTVNAARGAGASATGEPRGYDTARRLPRAGDGSANAASIAYPRPRDNAFAQTPSYAPQAAQPLQDAEAQVRRSAPSQPSAAASGGYPRGDRAMKPPAGFAPQGEATGTRAARTRAAAPQAAYSQPQTDANMQGFPSQPQPEPPQPFSQPSQTLATVQPGDRFTPDGSQYAPPAEQEIPDWLRAARQNNEPYHDTRRRAPRVEPAPQQPPEPAPTDLLGRPIARRNPAPLSNPLPIRADDYEAAGYPPELIARQREEDIAMAELGRGHKRHGAQYAAPPPRQENRTRDAVTGGWNATRPGEPLPARGDYPRRPPRAEADPALTVADPYYAPGSSPGGPDDEPCATQPNPYAVPGLPWHDDQSDDAPVAKDRKPVSILGVSVFIAAAVLIVLWIMQTSFTTQRESILTARAETAAKLVDNHPYAYRDLIEQESTSNNLHPAFVAAIVLNESSFNPSAESTVGARGLMQMMSDTAEWVHGKMGLTDVYSFDQMYDPEINVHYACWYLAYLSERFHSDPILVAAAFHAGQTTVQNWLNDSHYSADGKSITLANMAEGPTKSYVARVIKSYAVYRRLYYEGGLTAATTITTATATASVIAVGAPTVSP